MERVAKLLERVSELPFSPVAGKILEAARDERVGTREIASIIAQDQAFTARLLKICNSPYYAQTRAVTTVTQAVSVLGVDTITSLALALVTFSSFDHDEGTILTMQDLWEHSIACAIWGRHIAQRMDHGGAEETFVAGLLHDMGKALFNRFFKSDFLEAVRCAETEGIGLPAAERRILGTDHASAGAVVARKWNLPPVLTYAIEFHHQPLMLHAKVSDPVRKTVAIVHVSNVLSEHFQLGRGVEEEPQSISAAVWEILGLDLDGCYEMVGSVIDELGELRKILEIPPGRARPGCRSNEPRPENQSNERAPIMPMQEASAPGAQILMPGMQSIARLMEAGQQLAMLAGLDELYPNVATQAMTLVDADAAHVFLPAGDTLQVAGAAGLTQLKGKRFPMIGSLPGWVAMVGEMVVLPNSDKAACSWGKDYFAKAGLNAHLFLPIEWAGQQLAVLSVHARRPRVWSEQEVFLLRAFAGFVAVALENARLYCESEQKAKTLEGLNGKLAKALQVKARFLASISHELRSPLVVINGYANLIGEGFFGPVPAGMAEAVEKIGRQGDALMKVITCLIEISELDAGQLAPQRAPLNLTELLDDMAEVTRGLIGQKPIVLETDYERNLSPLSTDRQRLRQVLGCVLDNAVKFTAAGKIVLAAGAAEKAVEIVISDTGIGIEPKNLQVIFEGFRQVDDQDNRLYEGIGVGLYLSRRQIELLGGQISAESKPGAGSCFRISLPYGEFDPAFAPATHV